MTTATTTPDRTERRLRADRSPEAPLVLADYLEERGRPDDAGRCRLEYRWRLVLDRLAADPLVALGGAELKRLPPARRRLVLPLEPGAASGYYLSVTVAAKEVNVMLRHDDGEGIERAGLWHMGRLNVTRPEYRRGKARELAAMQTIHAAKRGQAS